MRTATLTRMPTSDDGTFGHLTTDTGKIFTSGELPWRDNHNGLSCIPEGTYLCTWHNSPSKGWVYMVNDVPSRADILIHPANFCGDKTLGKKTDLLGCIGLGHGYGVLEGQRVIVDSRHAIDQFEDEYTTSSIVDGETTTHHEDFTLTITS